MDVRDETHIITHVMQLAGKNISATFLRVKNIDESHKNFFRTLDNL